MVERTKAGGVLCSFAAIHIDRHMQGGALALAV